MPRIKPMSRNDLEHVILALGYVLERQTASHKIYWKEGSTHPLVLNDHEKKDI
ncbi:MAG: type II toxin-antitoxin system HicA family toxin [Desulfovibrio sp.]|nr:type II toxin-antitoxin system HicA family toxin [Desulfovibrio sp.]